MSPSPVPFFAAGRLRRRLRAEGGFVMIIALGVLAVVSLLTAAVFLTVQSDTSLTRGDLDGKRAYASAQAGLQAYLFALNQHASDSTWWQNCSNDTVTGAAVPASTYGATYDYTPVPANGAKACSKTSPVASLIDTPTGTLRMKFTGYSGNTKLGNPTKTIVASLKTLSPLSFIWYTVHETEDTSINSDGCDTFYWQGRGPPDSCRISWVTGDRVNGPMYTRDQLLIAPGDAPVFGRGPQDPIDSEVPSSDPKALCVSSQCYGASISNPVPNVTPQVPLPSDNANLATDAANPSHGTSFTGATTLHITGSTATGYDCVTATTCNPVTIDLTQKQIMYAANAPGCDPKYTPTGIDYTKSQVGGTGPTRNMYWGACGDIYVYGSYNTPITIAAANDVIVTGSLTNVTDTDGQTAPTGPATAGLVANEYVRVWHDCSGNPPVTIDAAILTLQHSFFVDNYNCGGSRLGTLTVHGAIAQFYRGIVGQIGNSGYLKNYNYDDRLALILPPYLFDLQSTEWKVFRETLCSPTAASSSPNSCAYTGA